MTLGLSVAAQADAIFTASGSAGTGSDPNDDVTLSSFSSVSIGGNGLGQLTSVTTSSTEINFNYTMPGTGNFGGGSIDVYRDILDESGNVEGVFRLQTDGGSTAHISYGSDVNITGSTHLVNLFPTATDLVDNGTVQSVVSFCPSTGCGTVDAAGDDLSTVFTVTPFSTNVGTSNTPETRNIGFLALLLLGLALCRKLKDSERGSSMPTR